MRKSLFLISFILATLAVYCQLPKPSWVKNTPFPPNGCGYIFVWGEGDVSTPAKAKNKAFADAVKKGLYELRDVQLSQQNIADIEEKGLDAVATFTQRAIKERCASEPIFFSKGDCKVYVLIQIEQVVYEPANFYMLPHNMTSCEDPKFEESLSLWNEKRRANIKKQEKAQQREDRKDNRKDKWEDSDFIWDGKNNYMSWGIINTGYPLKLATNFSGRHGGIIGIGYYANVGAEWGKVSMYKDYNSDNEGPIYHDDITLTHFYYEAGIKLFPYKGLFLSCGYGSIGCEKNAQFIYDPQDYGGGLHSSDKAEDACKKNRKQWQKTGLILAVGYDLIFADDLSAFISLSAGVSYDIKNKEWLIPSLGFTFGVGFKL